MKIYSLKNANDESHIKCVRHFEVLHETKIH